MVSKKEFHGFPNEESAITLEEVALMTDDEYNNLSHSDRSRVAELKKKKLEAKKSIRHQECVGDTGQDLREQVMKHGVKMISTVQDSMINDRGLSPVQLNAYNMLWPILTDIISKTDDLKVLDAKSASEIISSVAKGKMTLKDATIMMSIMRQKVEIEELPILLAKLSDLEGKQ